MGFIYDRQRQVERLLGKLDNKIINEFYESQRRLCGPAKMLRKLQCLEIVMRLAKKNLDRLDEADFRKVFDGFDAKYSDQTSHDYVGIIKQFCRWYDNGRYWPFVSWKRRRIPKSRLSSADILTDEEVGAIIGSTSDPMWKAFIEGLYHSRCRPGEFVSLKRKDIMFTDEETIIRVNGTKNNYANRDIIILEDMPRFRAYVESIGDPKAYLFPQMPYWVFRHKFKRIVRDSGLNKRVWFYLFRHSKYTFDVECGIRKETRDMQYGHAPNSNVGQVYYTHLSMRSVRDDLRRVFGNGHPKEKIMVAPFMLWGNN